MRWIVVASGLVLMLGLSLRAHGDEGTVPLADSGNWAALAHHAPMNALPDVCLAVSHTQGLTIRADRDGIEIILSSKFRSLPESSYGIVAVQVEDLLFFLKTDRIMSGSIEVTMSDSNLIMLLDKMDKSESMYITVDKANPVVVSLSGSTKATNAFRACAGSLVNSLSPAGKSFITATSEPAASGIYICAEHTDEDDWEDEFSRGSVVVPVGSVFDYGGHLMDGNLQDRMGSATESKGISEQEKKQRSDWLMQDMAVDQKNTSAVVTTQQITLTSSAPCALASAKVVISRQWGWTVAPISGDSNLYYQLYGVIRRGALDTGFDADDVPVNHLAARGQLNGSVRGILRGTLNLDEWTASQPPDELPVIGEGNSECWGDHDRQDISCRALTENFLLSMRGATKADVIKAMNVEGREIGGGLRFISNYSKGERRGSGSANFTFDANGRVSVIVASIDPPNMEGKQQNFVWNAFSAPSLGDEIDRSTTDYARKPFCSDMSGTPARCDSDSLDETFRLSQMSFNSTRAELLQELEFVCNLGHGIVVSDSAGDCERLRKILQ